VRTRRLVSSRPNKSRLAAVSRFVWRRLGMYCRVVKENVDLPPGFIMFYQGSSRRLVQLGVDLYCRLVQLCLGMSYRLVKSRCTASRRLVAINPGTVLPRRPVKYRLARPRWLVGRWFVSPPGVVLSNPVLPPGLAMSWFAAVSSPMPLRRVILCCPKPFCRLVESISVCLTALSCVMLARRVVPPHLGSAEIAAW
jgi:hypothetical protein